MKIKGAIFDMDGTILDSLMFWDILWRQIGEKYMGNAEFRPCDEVNKNVRTMIYADAMAYFKEYYNIPGETEDFVRFAKDSITEFYKTTAKPKAGAKEILESLKAKDIKLALASATSLSKIKLALEYHGMLKYFDFVLSCAEIGAGKEKPDIYMKAASLMELSPEDIAVFEDSFVALETARGAGFRTVGLFEKYNFNQERMKKASDIYMSEGETLLDIMDKIENV